MDAEWIKSSTARRIVAHWTDTRPAWLWSADGSTLLWRNAAARLANARIKKSGLKVSPDAVPIRGQVARLIRLGNLGRSSLSRVQFLAGDKPVSMTCSCTPLALPDDAVALLLVGIDPIPPDIRDAAGDLPDDPAAKRLLPPGAEYLLVRDREIVGGSPEAVAAHRHEIESIGSAPEGATPIRLPAGPDGTELILYVSPTDDMQDIAAIRSEEGITRDESSDAGEGDLANQPEPLLPLGLAPLDTAPLPAPASEEWVAPLDEPDSDRSLSSLFDRLAEDATLYSTLTAADEVFPGSGAGAEPPSDRPMPEPDAEMLGAVIEYADDAEETPAPAPSAQSSSLWMITGRGFRALEPAPPQQSPSPPEAAPDAPPGAGPQAEPPSADAQPAAGPGDAASSEPPPPLSPATAPIPLAPAQDPETVERVSRYNFAELSRILADRVSGEAVSRTQSDPPAAPRPAASEGVINLHAETLVLNRLPLAVMVFRDQQVLFANRALTDLLGHDSVQSLRHAGLSSIFPGDAAAHAGPVNRLLRRDGTPLTVTARLQSVSWQGRAALMLSASPSEPTRGHEGAVRTFAQISAEVRGEGFVVADRNGIMTLVSDQAALMLGRSVEALAGKPLAVLVARLHLEPLRKFLEHPARFAETTRPALRASTEDGSAELTLFAEGQAGVVTGYFGFLRRLAADTAPTGSDRNDAIEPGLLGRLSRGIRRPLNTIIGFADLMRTAAFGTPDHERTLEYARDIRTAGLEIAVLVDELDDFTRLRNGQYAPHPADVDLAGLLDSCVQRVRAQASAARVLVRSGISEQLPRIRADRPSLGQALLNLLASAIDQTPIGGSVILSANTDDEGNIAIHIRDGAEHSQDPGDRFVVFRDGVDKDGEPLGPVRSSVGLALTRSLLAVNGCSLSIDPTVAPGTLFSLNLPSGLIAAPESAPLNG
ncbi:MAG TPA: PAS domain-containing sensor histidine kinase [Hypericibacter adhaerens]|uniref:sensor histidine kinase n=1 Tax=Hypericibacter adhaerens TaxID=2602016 RepID=UPI002CCAE92F|nr:PAS domain-containing sensor histidine kinase [Hypericibacter adhaerens]HWA42342.1 PAS domain-containing sensor histidine kinase [Hypericibacter adhaerens]